MIATEAFIWGVFAGGIVVMIAFVILAGGEKR